MTAPPIDLPARFVNDAAVRAAHGHRVDLLGPWLLRADPLADAAVHALGTLRPRQGQGLLDRGLAEGAATITGAPPALREFVASLEAPPIWVDDAQLDLGGRAFLRCGVLGLLVLACGSLPTLYASPAGNKPLVLSRRLVAMAPRRLWETAQFVHEVCRPGGLRRGAAGYKIVARVRLIHAQMRRLVLRSGRWDLARWGTPINQVDMAFTNVQFSVFPLGWLEQLGVRMTAEEREALVQLWRYAGLLVGVDPTLLAASEREGRRLGDLIARTQEAPDDDARALTHALMSAAPTLLGRYADRGAWTVELSHGLARFLLGDALADGLALQRTRWFHAWRALRGALPPLAALRRAGGGEPDSLDRLYEAVLRNAVGAMPQYRLPDSLPHAAAAAHREGNGHA